MPTFSTDSNPDLVHALENALVEPTLIVELSTNLFGGQPIMRLSKPGATSRSKPVTLVPVIVADPDQRHSSMLRVLADLLAEEGR